METQTTQLVDVEIRTWECEDCESRTELTEDEGWPECSCLGTMYVISRRLVEVEEAI